jgi:hypothetical protein
MSLLRLLNVQGITGIAVSVALAVLLILQKGEARHWKKQSGHFEQLYTAEQTAFAGTVASYRAAAEAARAADQANLTRVATEQRAINERTSDDFKARIAAARLTAQRLRQHAAPATADPGARGSAPMSGLPASASGSPQGTGEDRLPRRDALTATEQAIQLDELIKWVRAQVAVETSKP